MNTIVGNQMELRSERDLHYKVVDCIRKHFPQMQIVAGLGELQDTVMKRSDAYKKGYTGGQPDLLILNQTHCWSGFAIELKNPTGNWTLSHKQEVYLENLNSIRYKTLVSDNYDEILIELANYYRDMYKETRHLCPHCNKVFKFHKAFKKHLRTKHESYLKV